MESGELGFVASKTVFVRLAIVEVGVGGKCRAAFGILASKNQQLRSPSL